MGSKITKVEYSFGEPVIVNHPIASSPCPSYEIPCFPSCQPQSYLPVSLCGSF